MLAATKWLPDNAISDGFDGNLYHARCGAVVRLKRRVGAIYGCPPTAKTIDNEKVAARGFNCSVSSGNPKSELLPIFDERNLRLGFVQEMK